MNNPVMRNIRAEVLAMYDPALHVRFGLHVELKFPTHLLFKYGLFMNAITSNASSEQQAQWLPAIMQMQIVGCFAMTELGHGWGWGGEGGDAQQVECTRNRNNSYLRPRRGGICHSHPLPHRHEVVDRLRRA
jgi:alkylation response protein AidB-like acyl-CoA dehydrogenase